MSNNSLKLLNAVLTILFGSLCVWGIWDEMSAITSGAYTDYDQTIIFFTYSFPVLVALFTSSYWLYKRPDNLLKFLGLIGICIAAFFFLENILSSEIRHILYQSLFPN